MRERVTHHICDCQREKMERLEQVATAAERANDLIAPGWPGANQFCEEAVWRKAVTDLRTALAAVKGMRPRVPSAHDNKAQEDLGLLLGKVFLTEREMRYNGGEWTVNPKWQEAVEHVLAAIVAALQGGARLQVPREALEWITSGNTGLSSEALWSFLAGVMPRHCAYPRDVDDFGRCVSLLLRVPGWREKIPSVAALSPEWATLVAIWDELERLYLRGEFESCGILMRQALKEVKP